MRNILWIGERHFADSLHLCGWEDVVVAAEPKTDGLVWEDVVALAGFEPDVVVASDLRPAILWGVENFPALTVYYSSQSCLKSWQFDYAQAFDACLVAQGAHLPRFAGSFLPSERIWWSPPFADSQWQPAPGAATLNGIFMHSAREAEMPQKTAFWRQLAGKTDLTLCSDKPSPELYAAGRVVVSHPEHGELETGIFEVMGAGACLVTPRLGQGLEKLFVDGEHYVGYAPGDVGDAAYRINFLLENPELHEYIGQTAAREIDARHRAIHRAEAFTDHLCDLAINDPKTLIASRRGHAEQIQARIRGCFYCGKK